MNETERLFSMVGDLLGSAIHAKLAEKDAVILQLKQEIKYLREQKEAIGTSITVAEIEKWVEENGVLLVSSGLSYSAYFENDKRGCIESNFLRNPVTALLELHKKLTEGK